MFLFADSTKYSYSMETARHKGWFIGLILVNVLVLLLVYFFNAAQPQWSKSNFKTFFLSKKRLYEIVYCHTWSEKITAAQNRKTILGSRHSSQLGGLAASILFHLIFLILDAVGQNLMVPNSATLKIKTETWDFTCWRKGILSISWDIKSKILKCFSHCFPS